MALVAALLALSISPSEADAYFAGLNRTTLGLLVFCLVFSLSAEPISSLRAFVSGSAVGLTFFVVVIGLRVVDPTEIGWALRLDWQWHYLGWEFFRREEWGSPPGRIQSVFAPFGTSIALMDSLPLLAFFIKPLNHYLPSEFQYLGLSLAVSFCLVGAMSAMFLRSFGAHRIQLTAGTWLIVSSPILLNRIGHVALSWHWLILGILYAAVAQDARRIRVALVYAFVALAALTHPYLLAMCGILGVGALVDSLPRSRSVLHIPILMLVAGSLAWVSGLLVLSNSGSLAERGLGEYGTNLFAFAISHRWSRVLPDTNVALEAQRFESFAFLGTGVLLLAVTVISSGVFSPRRTADWVRTLLKEHPALVAALIALTFLSLGPVFTAGQSVLFAVPEKWTSALAMFRVTGRFIWPLAYATSLAIVVATFSRFPNAISTTCLILACVVQTWDHWPIYRTDYRAVRSNDAFYAEPPVARELRAIDLGGLSSVSFVMPQGCGATPEIRDHMARIAAIAGLPINDGHAARIDRAARAAICEEAKRQLQPGGFNPSTLYVVAPNYLQYFENMKCDHVSNIALCRAPAAQ